MSKTFREWKIDQPMLFPPSVLDLVPAGHTAHFVRNLVMEELDVASIVGHYSEGRGYPPYHPVMMTSLMLYAYTQGIYSSRRIAQACQQRVDFMAVTGMQNPDFRTINTFRKRHLRELSGLFVQVVRLCRNVGMVKLGHVAVDGTRLSGNASKAETMKYSRMKKTECELEAEVAEWFRKGEQIDAAEDEEYGVDRRGDELPEWVTDKTKRLQKLREAKAELEAEAKARAEEKKAEDENKPPRNRARKPIADVPGDDEKKNLTDGNSRLLRTGNGYIQGYNAQIAVDANSQVIVAQMLTNEGADESHLIPIVDQVRRNLGKQAKEVSADTGYYSEANLKALKRRRLRGYIATGRRLKEGEWTGAVGPFGKQMRQRLKRGGRWSRYRLRGQTVEPVFGTIKAARAFRQFLLRGIEKVQSEWSLICTAHNILKLAMRTS